MERYFHFSHCLAPTALHIFLALAQTLREKLSFVVIVSFKYMKSCKDLDHLKDLCFFFVLSEAFHNNYLYFSHRRSHFFLMPNLFFSVHNPTVYIPATRVHSEKGSTGECRAISTQTPADLGEGTFCISFAFSVAIIGTLNVNSARLNRQSN